MVQQLTDLINGSLSCMDCNRKITKVFKVGVIISRHDSEMVPNVNKATL